MKWNREFLLIIILISLLPKISNSQISPLSDTGKIGQINSLSRLIITSNEDEVKIVSADRIQHQLLNELKNRPSNLIELDSLKNISYLVSRDDRVRIITWTVPLLTGEYLFYGILSVHDRNEEGRVFKLNDASALGGDLTKSTLNPEEWFGAVYYELIELNTEDADYFTLIGWKGNDQITTKKVIDVLSFDKFGNPLFGAPMFYFRTDSIQYRCIYEFSSEVSMSLNYDSETSTIIMDHLFPSNPDLMGNFEFYGPDLSYDAFKFNNGKWEYIDDFDPGIRPDNKKHELKKGIKVYEP